MSLTLLLNGHAKTVINTGDPVGFFTTIANNLLHNTFNFGVTNIPVYTNGVFVYTPAVQRILQLSANVYDATTTNFYPTVFRPIFEYGDAGNIFVVGYTNLNSASGPNTVSSAGDLQLSTPWDIVNFTNAGASHTPILQNIYGVPWIIGAKKGFPNFNKFGMQTIVQVTRRLQVQRSSIPTVINSTSFRTNQWLTFSISNSINTECWNSYTNTYNNPIQIFAADTIAMRITNSLGYPDSFNNYQITTNVLMPSWPGYNITSAAMSFTNPLSGVFSFITNSGFYFGSAPPGISGFAPVSAGWESNRFDFQFPQFVLLTTNRLQLYMLDNNHVIDYVHFAGPQTTLDITATIESNNPVGIGYGVNMWSQTLAANGAPYGITGQMMAGTRQINAYNGAQYWLDDALTEAQVDGFANFMGFSYPYPATLSNPSVQGTLQYDSTNHIVQDPYTPTATILQYTSWQVNDPLVHYLSSDLNFSGTEVGSYAATGVQVTYGRTGDVVRYPYFNIVNDRYQPWGFPAPLPYQNSAYNFLNPYNLTYKDPLVWSADDWNFPTNLLSSLAGLGQVHRGTPWQTVYLKADNILHLNGTGNIDAGTNTWMAWTGDYSIADAALTAPVNDRPLVSLLVALLNTNNLTQLISVNDQNPSDWLNALNGLIVYSNSAQIPPFHLSPGFMPLVAFDSYIMVSDSSQAQIIAAGIVEAKAVLPNQFFHSTGDILSAPELTETSPWLNLSNTNLLHFGITDMAYEAIPAQLLLLLRPDSIGSIESTNGVWNLQFSGSDAFSYELQTSTNLVNWMTLNTNNPIGGKFTIPTDKESNPAKAFYRSVLIP